MKLVYIWFEMKNIVNAVSYNLGSRYTFSFNHETSELNYQENVYYIENFFTQNNQKNLIEINGIIGANGVGKTSILNNIRNIVTGQKTENYIVIIEKDKKFIIHTNQRVKFKKHNDIEVQYKWNRQKYNTIYFSNVIDAGYFNNKNIARDKHIDVTTNYLIQKDIRSFYLEDLYNQILFVGEFGKTDFSLICNIPQSIYLYLTTIELDSPVFLTLPQKQIENIIKNNMEDKELMNKEPRKKSFYRKMLKNCSYYVYSEIHSLLKNELGSLKYLLEKPVLSLTNEFVEKENKSLRDQFAAIKNVINEKLDIENHLKQKFKNRFDCLEKEIEIIYSFIIDEKVDEFQGVGANGIRARINIKTISQDANFLFMKWNQYGLGGLIWTELSSGEYGFLNMFSRIYAAYKKLTFDPIKEMTIILIDEGELYFHPQWQKQMIKILLEGVGMIFEKTNKPLQIILTTHSPFILSDLPSDRNLFLKRDESNEVVCLDNLEDTHLTFGANIHHLYSHAFFLQDGLMGEFAKEKINALIHELLINTPEYISINSQRIRNNIHIIGEPIIKRKLIQIFEEQLKLLKPNQTAIKDEIEKLLSRVEKLEQQLKQGE
ncbi:AAA family ATPase [Paenibacillus sp. MMS20-IR301]|uniref:AAA family ATPase n=1 Tax=Paenibacillus sp. MMS20-IR301 TaxID=2895946 RepID=UPI0028EF18D9|nr:AAA family ATPase [Paenibacillus sp. MMS20-IR301]WNS41582.1 AAA family ATPase [Paenibacillus sp. MMS20-IR301]